METPIKSDIEKAAKAIGLDADEIIVLVAWVQGEGYWSDRVNDPYLAYLSGCVIINSILDGYYGRGHAVIEKIASLGSYYSDEKQAYRYITAGAGAMKATLLALEHLQTGIHACYGPGKKPDNCFYDSGFQVNGKTIYVF